VIFGDEAYWLSSTFYYESVLPRLRQPDVSFVMATSPGNSFGVLDVMCQAYFPGTKEKMVRQVTIDLVCAECRALGPPASETCQCESYKRPKHISQDRDKALQNLFGDAFREQFQREIGGISVGENDRIFTQESLDDLFDPNNTVSIVSPASMVWVFMDPAGGGNAHHAIIAYVISRFMRTVRFFFSRTHN